MADWQELFKSDDFREYRKKQVETIALVIQESIRKILHGYPEALSTVHGELKAANELLKLPERLTTDEGTLEILGLQLTNDIADITRILVRDEVLDR